MLVTFTTADYGDVIMFGEVGLAMLRLMGHSASVPGALLAHEVPAALARLRAALAQAESPPADATHDQDPEVTGEPAVGLGQRAAPLIKLLEAAVASDSRVMWK